MCLLDIDVQGVASVKLDPALGPAASVVFVRPVSVQALERRLRDRGTETEEDIQKVIKKIYHVFLFSKRFFNC